MEILLVEDNPGDVFLIQSTLEDIENLNAQILVKTNGLAAYTYINNAERAPDLVILDLNLPYKNGFEVLSELISRELFNNVPVVIFTSSNNQMDTVKAISMGAKAYVIKPIELEEYRTKVISFLKYVHSRT